MGTLALAVGGFLTPLAPASADVGVPVPVVIDQSGLPDPGQVTPPTVGGGCVETADTGWVCPGDATTLVSPPGLLPGATDPDAFTVDPVAEAAKDQYAAETAPTITEYLADGLNAPVPPLTDLPVLGPTPHPYDEPGNSGSVGISGYAQGNHPWCVPASTDTMLTVWGVNPSLSGTASAEGSTQAGTPIGNARPFLNKHESTMYYRYDAAGSASQVFNHAADDIGGYGAPLMISVYTGDLQWWQNQPANNQGLHALTIYAYYSQSGGGFEVWDTGFATANPITLADTWTAMSAGNAGDAEIW